MESIHGYIDNNYSRFREELLDFLRIPSVSARREYASDMARAAEWLAGKFQEAGLEKTRVELTPGHPIVLGEWQGAGPSAPTLLIYGHYDVQPPEPLDLWTDPPFEPVVRDGRIYARGSVDNKGQLFAHLKAIEAYLKSNGQLPVNVILLAEGEEEVGSPNLLPFVENHAERLQASGIIISDSFMVAPGVPTIGASLRGLACVEVQVTGPASDLHSGSYGGALLNPAAALTRIIASLHDDDLHVTVPGFYDDVLTDPAYGQALRHIPFHEDSFLHSVGAPELRGETGFSTLERLWTRPTLEVNGIFGGYAGEGPKTVLPARAGAKLSCRLVPNQDPARISRLLQEHIESLTPSGVTVSVEIGHSARPWRARDEGPLYDAARRALRHVFQQEPVPAGEGGSIPIVPEFEKALKAPVLLLGFGLPGSNAHAPDEWFGEEELLKGMHTSARMMAEMGRLPK